MSNETDSSGSDSVRTMLRTSARNSMVVTVTRTGLSRIRYNTDRMSGYLRSSILFRWLTRGPDPAVVVIDLRETYTVGPLIVMLDALRRTVASFEERIAPIWQHSQASRVYRWSCLQLHRVADTRLGRTILALSTPTNPETERNQD